MRHYSCDGCGKMIPQDGVARYVMQMELALAPECTAVGHVHTEQDAVEGMAELLDQLPAEEPPLPERKQQVFDLCDQCAKRLSRDPLGRERLQNFAFSEN